MIKQTYYNLPSDKRERIMKAIVKETESKSYDKISINKIVKDAGISRGSFYQYFDDKWDLLILMLKDFYIRVSRECIDALKSSGGDIFGASEKVFRFVIVEYYSEKYGSALKTLFLHSNVNTVEFLKRKRDNECGKSLLDAKGFDRILKRRIFDEFGIAPEIQYTGTLEIDEHSDDFQQAIQNAETEIKRENDHRLTEIFEEEADNSEAIKA